MIGRIEPKFVLKNGVDPEGEPYSYYERTDKKFYYINDHLGSIRLTINEDNTISSAQDYNAFGGILPGRSYVSGSAMNMYKFTGKERDTESNLDYFGARYYDSEIGRWLSVDPLADKYPGWSPYNYCANNPLKFVDPDGMGVFITGPDADRVTNLLSKRYGIELRRDKETGLLSAYSSDGMAITNLNGFDGELKEFLNAMFSTSVQAELTNIDANTFEGDYIQVGAMDGSNKLNVKLFDKELTIGTFSRNVFNLKHSEIMSNYFQDEWGTPSNDAAHEILEAFYLGVNYPDYKYDHENLTPYNDSHAFALGLTFNNPDIQFFRNNYYIYALKNNTNKKLILYNFKN